MRIILGCLLITVLGCAQAPVTAIGGVQAMPPDRYAALLSSNTRHTNQYVGLYQTFQADVTILTAEVQTALVRQRASFKGWDEHQFQTEREKSVQENGAYAKFFLRFFVPEHDYDDLDKAKTIWKIYLEYGGHRFEGKVKKMTEKLVEIQTLFPHVDRFSTSYEITFNIPMNTVEQGASKVGITSSLGTAEFAFPVGK